MFVAPIERNDVGVDVCELLTVNEVDDATDVTTVPSVTPDPNTAVPITICELATDVVIVVPEILAVPLNDAGAIDVYKPIKFLLTKL